MAKEFQQDSSASCISTEPTMCRDVSSSNPRDFKAEEHELNDAPTHGADLIKLSVRFVFMISSLVAILTSGGFVSHLPLVSAAEFAKVFDFTRTAVRIPGTLAYLTLGSGAVLVLAGAYIASRKKQNKVVPVVVGDAEAEIPYENGVVKSPVRPGSSPVEASCNENWKPISGLDVNLLLEYCPVESSSLAKKDSVEHCSVTRDKEERKTRRKSMSSITYNNAISHEASVGSSPSSYGKAGVKRGEEATPLRRSNRIRNQALSTPSDGRMLISSRG